MPTPFRKSLSHLVGWAADRHVPSFLRGPLYRGYARFTGADLEEARGPLAMYPSLAAFFVRRLKDGTRPIGDDPGRVVSPVDGTYQTICPIHEGSVLQAKGRAYGVRELLGGVGTELELEGGYAWTIYLSPRDYHRIHAPEAGRLTEARWIDGTRYSVAPGVLDRRLVLPMNERVSARLETERGPLLLVFVGALNVGRIRVVGVEPSARADLGRGRQLARGEELARFEMGSTVVVISPPGGLQPLEESRAGATVRLGEAMARWTAPEVTAVE